MRYIYACFKGYIGFYNGLGLEKVEIDFSKCRNNIVLICGANGTGKSTLLNSLNPFPDSSSSFIPNKDAEKILTLYNAGDTYNIRIVSPADTKSGRKQTKAFISKNGLELNENGNITTYKEIIFSEFELDSNYISLTKLSSNDRGLADKTPAERKKFASSIVDNLETYNDIYKTLNKKSLIFKSHINTLHTKIQNIGSKDNLEITLNSLKQKNDNITSSIMSLNNKIVELQTRASINQEEMENINELKLQEKELSDKESLIMNQLILLKKRTKIEFEDIDLTYQNNLQLKNEYCKSRDELKISWKSESDRLLTLVNSINELKANLEMYSGDIDTDLENRYNISKQKVDSLILSLKKNGIPNDTSLIHKLTNLLEFYAKFIKKIDLFYDGLHTSNLKYICLNFDNDRINVLNNELSETLFQLHDTQTKISEYTEKMKSIAILENRPSNCKLDNCYFISEALKIKKELGNIVLEDEIAKLHKSTLLLSDKSTELQNEIENENFCIRKKLELDLIIDSILEIQPILKIFNDNILSDINKFCLALSDNSQFNDQRDPRLLLDSLNTLKELEYESSSFKILEIEYKSLQDKLKMIEKSSQSILSMEKEVDSLKEKVSNYKSSIDNFEDLIISIDSNLVYQKQYLDLYSEYKSVENLLLPIKEKINEIESKSSDSIKSIVQINEMKNEINRLTQESNPIVSDIHRISGQLTMLDSYYKEYELYKVKYDMIETLKKYCSPTSGGIQTIFMQLYMSKTLDLANQILGMLFGGEYKLLDFVINQNEFRIPFIGSGLAVDDISSGSTSQVCIMGMAINLALFHQASTKFNIARLDEITSGSDSYNRSIFMNVLNRIISLFEMEQLFVISHDLEADTSLVDIIKLKTHKEFDNVLLGNIIFDYEKEIDKTLN